MANEQEQQQLPHPHDLIYVGEIGKALHIPSSSSSNSSSDSKKDQPQQLFQNTILPDPKHQKLDQILRLPLLLRLLSSAQQPYSSIPSIPLLKKSKKSLNDHDNNDDDEFKKKRQQQQNKESFLLTEEDINIIINDLEAVATSTPVAENMDVITTYLAPYVSRKISKCKLLRRSNIVNNNVWEGDWDYTTELKNSIVFKGNVASNNPKKQQKLLTCDVDEGGLVDSMDDEMEGTSNSLLPSKNRRSKVKSSSMSNNIIMSSGVDSQEMTVSKLLEEITSLLLQSLQLIKLPTSNNKKENNEEKPTTADTVASAVDIPTSKTSSNHNDESSNGVLLSSFLSSKTDSLLVSKAAKSDEGSDISAILPAILHHAPVLRHEHVANALCRSLSPQTPMLVTRMVSNCPWASACVLKGCFHAYFQAEMLCNRIGGDNVSSSTSTEDGSGVVSQCKACKTLCKSSIQAIANLSPREAMYIMAKLSKYRIMPDLFLVLLIQYDTCNLSSILLSDLVLPLNNDNDKKEEEPQKQVNDHTTLDTKKQHQHQHNSLRSRTTADQNNETSTTTSSMKPNNRHNIRKIRKNYNSSITRITTPSTTNSNKKIYSWLKSTLINDTSIAMKTRHALLSYLSSIYHPKQQKVEGEVSLILQAYTLLLYHIGIGSGSTHGSGSKFVQDSITILFHISQTLKDQHATSHSSSLSAIISKVRNIALSALIMTWCRYPPIIEYTNTNNDPLKKENNNTNSVIVTSSTIGKTSIDCLKLLLDDDFIPNDKSTHDNATCARISAWILGYGDINDMWTFLLHPYYNHNSMNGIRLPSNKDKNDLHNVCTWINNAIATTTITTTDHGSNTNEFLFKIMMSGITSQAILQDASAAKDALNYHWKPYQSKQQDKDVSLYECLCNIFSSKTKCDMIFSFNGIISLIHSMVHFLDAASKGCGASGVIIPMVLPNHLEILQHKLFRQVLILSSHDNSDTNITTATEKEETTISIYPQFVLQLLYAFEFLEQFPKSPFIFDPRSFSCLKAKEYCYNYFTQNSQQKVSTFDQRNNNNEVVLYSHRLHEMISKYCPEVLLFDDTSSNNNDTMDDKNDDILPISCSNEDVSRIISNAIRQCIHNNNDDPDGCIAEMIYQQVRTRKHCNTTLVDTTAICALLSSSSYSPPPYYTWKALCKDPLILLQCCVDSWYKTGIRRIILSLLGRLIEANTHITLCPSSLLPPDPTIISTAYEMIFARDLIIVRCLVIIASGGYCNNNTKNGHTLTAVQQPIHCLMTIAFVRNIISKQSSNSTTGLVTSLLKQGLSYTAVDWLIEFVPETFNDAKTLVSYLSSERSVLSASERLALADATLRIAIIHGSREEADAQLCVYTAMSCLIQNFFLIVGPSGGVPVNVLCEEGLDVTEKCRHSTFRMLSILQRINGSRELIKNEALIGLSKIASLCKSESLAGAAGPAVARRRAVLKDIWDATVRAVNAMGGGIQI